MDAYLGYNQIAMHPLDQEHTRFVTDKWLYCYNVMPFRLKNAGATYQRLVNRMFASQIGVNMEVYVDDMLVKTKHQKDHVKDLTECFTILRKYNMKLNPQKCSFGVSSRKFLGFIVNACCIEANPKKIRALIEMPSPKKHKDFQSLTGSMAALSRYISKSIDKCLPFFNLLRGNKKFEWTEECETAFQAIKKHMSQPPILSKPEAGESLIMYLATTEHAISSVLVREDGRQHKQVYYVSKRL